MPRRAPALAEGVTLIAIRREGGGQEQAAQTLGQALAPRIGSPVTTLTLLEAARDGGGLVRAAAEALAKRAPTALHALTPFLARCLTHRTVVVFQGNGFFLIPYLRRRGHRVVAVCDAPPRPRDGLMGLRERMLNPLLRGADVVVRTFDFATPFAESPVVPNILPDYPAAAHPFRPGPTRRLFYVGRLEASKGFAAFLRLARDIPELDCHIFGAGALENDARAAQMSAGNVRYHGHSRGWLGELSAGACLVGCAPLEGCWTAGREALLHGIPLIFVPSLTGGPQAYARYTDKAVQMSALEREPVLAAVARVDSAVAANDGAAERLWREHDPERIADAFARLCR